MVSSCYGPSYINILRGGLVGRQSNRSIYCNECMLWWWQEQETPSLCMRGADLRFPRWSKIVHKWKYWLSSCLRWPEIGWQVTRVYESRIIGCGVVGMYGLNKAVLRDKPEGWCGISVLRKLEDLWDLLNWRTRWVSAGVLSKADSKYFRLLGPFAWLCSIKATWVRGQHKRS